MLELIHGAAVGQKAEGTGHVAEVVLLGIRPEEALHPGVGEELHTHGVDLGRIEGGPGVFHGPLAPAGVHLEGMAELVGQHVDVVARPVEVGKDVGGLVLVDEGAVAAGGLAVLGLQVHEFGVL